MDVFSADWLAICRRIVAAQRAIFAEARTSEERTVYEGVGEGGDRTLVIDRRCEDVVFAELDKLAAEGASFVAVSEERGEVGFGDGGEARVVIDPIDGSLNARRTIPSAQPQHRRRLRALDGRRRVRLRPRLRRRRGVRRRAAARARRSTASRSRVARRPSSWRWSASSRPSRSGRCRPRGARPARSTACGSSARSRSPPPTSPPAASTRCSSLRPCRSVDAAAAQLIVREAGGAVAFGDVALEEATLGPRRPLPDRRRRPARAASRPSAPRSWPADRVTLLPSGLQTCVR